ncbi:MAG: RNB domain-containing ribonuclease [Deltaproteobacteria bacterium]|nr:RNB domain-containing ribonuclease [Deltaproteobacteria bacterium]
MTLRTGPKTPVEPFSNPARPNLAAESVVPAKSSSPAPTDQPRDRREASRAASTARASESASIVKNALDKVLGSKTFVSIRSQPNGNFESIRGKLERRFEHGSPVARILTREGSKITVDLRDVEGVPEGGAIVLRREDGRYYLDPSATDSLRSFVGRVEIKDGRAIAVSSDPKSPVKSIPLEENRTELAGQTVLLHVEDGLSGKRKGELREVLASDDPWRRAFAELAVRSGVEATFSKRVVADVERIKSTFDPNEMNGYTDLTQKYFFSIDNPYSKDFDQAMCIEPNPEKPGTFDVYYAIADLSYFLSLAGPNSALLERAKRVQTTTYLPGFDFPVLPREISEGLCSLNQGQTRPAFVIKMSIGENGELGTPSFIDGKIVNSRNGNYPEAQKHLDGQRTSDPKYADGIDRLKIVGERLLREAKKRGMFTSDSGEKWATIDPNSKKLGVEHRGHLWIEEANAQISIAANALIGKYLIENGAPAFHRRHDDPEPKRIQRAQGLARQLGFSWAASEAPGDVLKRLDLKTAKGRALRKIVLRAMPRAHVAAELGSHFGLKLAEYVQSTAPMRRTRDAFNHASVRAVRDSAPKLTANLDSAVDQAVRAEDRQRLVEREVQKHIAAAALAEKKGQTLAAEVVGLSPFGVDLYFPLLDVEASISFHDLPGGPFRLEQGGLSATSQDGRTTLKVASEIQAKIAEVDPFAPRIRIEVNAAERAGRVEEKRARQGVESIEQVRGDGFLSPLVGQRVTTRGVVTAVNGVGFFIQPAGAKTPAQGGGLLVRVRGHDVSPGDLVEVSATVRERRDAEAPLDRSIVELAGAKVRKTGADSSQLPRPVVLGGDPATTPPSDPKAATDFWRKLLGQRVTVPSATAVCPSNRFGDLVVLPESWSVEGAARSAEGGIIMPAGRWNHQCVSLKFREHVGHLPPTSVGAKLSGIEGVVTFRSGSFQIELSKSPGLVAAPARKTPVTSLVGTKNSVTVASVNALNLHPGERDRARLVAERIAKGLSSPDVVGLQEIQDNDGPTASIVTDASKTYEMLIEEIKRAGGPTYKWVDLAPKNGEDGGQPGGNIRCGYLYRPDRVTLLPETVVRVGDGIPAFEATRKSLAARFRFGEREILLVNNHLSSRRGSSSWTSDVESPVVGKAEQREAQAKAIRQWVDGELTKRPETDVLMIGDMNDWGGSPTVDQLSSGGFLDLSQLVPEDKRFDYNYRGTLQTLQPPVGSPSLAGRAEVEILHKSVFSPIEDSDHDPVVIRLQMELDG